MLTQIPIFPYSLLLREQKNIGTQITIFQYKAVGKRIETKKEGMNVGIVDYGHIGRSISIRSHNFFPICDIKRKSISRLRDPYTHRRQSDFPAMEQFKLQIMATGGNEKQSEVDPNNAIPSFEVVKELLPNALVWTSLHGFVVGDRSVQRSGQVPGVGLTHAPFSLFPAPFPETCWSQACDLAPLFNELVDRVSMDGVFLQESLSGTRKVDDFTARLLDIHSTKLQANIRQEIRLGLHRSDYMLDTETGSLLQIELNTISSSFAGLGCLVSQLHRGQRVVSVVYFRAGYTPTDYPSEAEWRARLMLEMSSAIKCPSISYHLAGSKKVQQELAKPNVLERFINDKDDALKLRKCFAGLWSLDYNAKIVQDAITRPEAFVLKPQREGGGNNIYGKDVKEKLLELEKSGGDGHAAYILMQRIFPPIHTSYLVRDGNCQQNQTVSELGIFGAYLRNKENVLINNQSGYLMRTKVASSDEGGVAAGFAVLDSIYLT